MFINNKLNKLLIITFAFCLLLIGLPTLSGLLGGNFSHTVTKASSDLGNRLDEIEDELEKLKQEKQNIQNILNSEELKRSQYGYEIATLSKEIEYMVKEIQEKNLVVEKLNLEIDILDYQIDETREDIDTKVVKIDELEEETYQRLRDMYLNIKTYSNYYILFHSKGAEDYVKNDLYTTAIQETTNDNLESLQQERAELEAKRNQLDTDRIQIEKDKTLLDEEKIVLEKQQTLLNQRKTVLSSKVQQSLNYAQQQQLQYEQSSTEEQELLAEQELLKQKLFDEINSIPNGQFVLKGTVIGYEGMTGWATGPHVHFGVAYNGTTQNPCNFLNCAARGDGQLKWPISPAGQITSGYGPRFDGFHPALDISTGTEGRIIAAHDGFLMKYSWPCYDLTWVKCNGGAAKYAVICQDKNNCNNGFKTQYWHLK